MFGSNRSRRLLLVARLALTAGVVVYAVRLVDCTNLIDTLLRANLPELVAATTLQGCAVTVAASRWQRLLAVQGIFVGWAHTARITFGALFFNQFFLGTVAGDAAKFTGVLPLAPERKGLLLLSLLQDRIVGLGGLLLLLTGFLGLEWTHLASAPSLRAGLIAVPAACAAFLAGITILCVLHASPRLAALPSFLGAGTLPMVFPMAAFPTTLLLSVVIHVFAVAAGYFTASALGVGLSWSAAGTVFGATTLALSLPLTVAGLGVREAALFWLLAWFGIRDAEIVIGISVCLLSINLFWAFVGGILFHWPVSALRAARRTPG